MKLIAISPLRPPHIPSPGVHFCAGLRGGGPLDVRAMVLVQCTASAHGVASLAPSMLTTKVVDASLPFGDECRLPFDECRLPRRLPFDFKADLIGTLLSVSLCAPASLPCKWDSGLAHCAEAWPWSCPQTCPAGSASNCDGRATVDRHADSCEGEDIPGGFCGCGDGRLPSREEPESWAGRVAGNQGRLFGSHGRS